MKKTEFDKQNLKDKGNFVLLDQGKFIASRDYYNHRLVLYDLGEFFAEIWYEPQNNKIQKIESVEIGDKKIDRYIDAKNK